ncbi:hypothetical protein G647_07763 [Cladophialophora carrionii CBS 160.54]|uniref:Ion transport domain-containing protein n=1 Tax=Cladophialophora carrionii CBS 160.54 TaxID=1279043 RepID=V9D449_9EURO|nr:uncharacterized protein G647_07763 [Cladophialophora carrionii CBS 160.54]ETI21416.1 hypothetical protein G647_07763 [Cladophialophora carrionii CBS 160.54]
MEDEGNDSEADDDEEEVDDEDGADAGNGDEDEDGLDDREPLLPIFSAAHLDAIPVFALTHAVRLLVTSRCDTVLSWEQLRAPQISQFLVKPIEQEIRNNHLNAATHYALMANCLQYGKEAAMTSGNSGTNRTRAMVCELLAIKMLRDFSTRGLIDALSYDFDPLQGHLDAVPHTQDERRSTVISRRGTQRPARISCFEIAIRAQAKKFLSHPMVVKQLEAIWAGTIVFHSAADNLHRQSPSASKQLRSYGTSGGNSTSKLVPTSIETQPARRAVTLYNPRDASLFKLSRLRVPRYRNILSTLSFAVLLSLFVAVLVERSLEITTLEVIFWFWAAGYMLDEIVGFNEQGFSLYIASFWNTFDLGILVLLLIHLALRLYGILMPDVRKHYVANMAYDVLAADAILLFPRLFSVLDHYRYFSPLLIAFRYMAADLVAVSLLILISCSGFFVALTLSFGKDGVDTPSSVAYALLQMLMGFTPAAWDRWNEYNALGKTILTLFLFICHFLVVTILITVLTNSFMAIVRNANEEHQFLFAVNTISHVKSDALFSYVAPTNILQWLLVPLRYFVPFRQYVKVNRTIIKITHLPLLFSIFVYEKTILQSTVYDSIDLVDHRSKGRRAPKFPRLTRAPSIATFRQDRALEEVFRQPFDATVRGAQRSRDLRKASNVVNTWMSKMGDDAVEPPQEQDRQVVDRLEAKGSSFRRPRHFSRVRDFSRRTMSVVSDPADFATAADVFSPAERQPVMITPSAMEEPNHHTDADGDDELHTNDEIDEEETTASETRPPNEDERETHNRANAAVERRDYFTSKQSPTAPAPDDGQPVRTNPHARLDKAYSPRHGHPSHTRNVSTATMIFKPVLDSSTEQSSSIGGTIAPVTKAQVSAPASGTRTPLSKPGSHTPGHRTPKRPTAGPTRMRPVLPGKSEQAFRSTPNLAGLLPVPGQPRRRPSLELDLVSDIGDNQAVGGGFIGALPSSFAAHVAKEAVESRHAKEQKEQQEMFTKIMMARMNSLEESFRDVIHEMRSHLRHGKGASQSRGRGRKDRFGEKEAIRPATADADTERPSPKSSRALEKRTFAQSEPGATVTETADKEAKESGKIPAHDRPVSR